MNVQEVKLADLKAHPENYNIHPDSQIKELMDALAQFGQTKNIIVSDGVILAGHGLVEAAKRLGLDTLMAEIRDGISEQEKAAILLTDNATMFGVDTDSSKLNDLLGTVGDNAIPGVTDGGAVVLHRILRRRRHLPARSCDSRSYCAQGLSYSRRRQIL